MASPDGLRPAGLRLRNPRNPEMSEAANRTRASAFDGRIPPSDFGRILNFVDSAGRVLLDLELRLGCRLSSAVGQQGSAAGLRAVMGDSDVPDAALTDKLVDELTTIYHRLGRVQYALAEGSCTWNAASSDNKGSSTSNTTSSKPLCAHQLDPARPPDSATITTFSMESIARGHAPLPELEAAARRHGPAPRARRPDVRYAAARFAAALPGAAARQARRRFRLSGAVGGGAAVT